MKKMILAAVLLAAAVPALYKFLVTDRIMDRGDTLYHGPVDDPPAGEPAVLLPEEGAQLTLVSYTRSGDSEQTEGSRYILTVEDGQALFSCSAVTAGGEPLELKDVPVDIAAVQALDKTLRGMELLEYPVNERGPDGEDTRDVTLRLEWSDGTAGSPLNAQSAIDDFFRGLVSAARSEDSAGHGPA